MTIGLLVTHQMDPFNTWQVSKAMVELYHEIKCTMTKFNEHLVALHGAEQHAEGIHRNGVKHCTLWMFITINDSKPKAKKCSAGSRPAFLSRFLSLEVKLEYFINCPWAKVKAGES